MKSKLIFLLFLLPLCAKSQSPAKTMADMMQAEVNLDAKQYKAVYSLFTKDFKFIQKHSSQGGMPPHGGNPDFAHSNNETGFSVDSRGANVNVDLGHGASVNGSIGASGGGIGLKGGITIGGSSRVQGGGVPMQGGGGPSGEMHNVDGPGHGEMPIPKKYLEKEDAKLKKILLPEQYRLWKEKHPSDYLTYLYHNKNQRMN